MGGQSVIIRDENAVASVDGISRALTQIDVIHARIHEGLFYTASFIDPAVVASGTLELLIRVPAQVGAHARFTASIGGDGQGQLFEAPTTSADGTPLAAINRNRFSGNTADVLVFGGPTVTGDGTQLTNILIPGGTFISAGGEGKTFDEFVLAPGDYLARLTNLTTGDEPAGLQLAWYESANGSVAI